MEKYNSILSEKILSAIFSHQNFFLVCFSKDLEILETNVTVENFYQLDKKDISKKGIDLFSNEPELHELFKNKNQFLNALKAYKNHLTFKTNPAPNSFISWEVMGMPNAEGSYDEILVLGYDISEEILKEKTIKDKYFRLESMISHLPGNVYWMDENCVHLGCNNNVLNMLGITREEYVDKAYEDLVQIGCLTWEQSQSFKGDDLEVMELGEPKFNIEEPVIKTKDGGELYFLTTRVPLYNQTGKITGVAGISIDVSEIKKTQLALKEAKEKAEAANRAKSEFIANMSHDIRTPITGILGMLNELLYLAEEINNSLEGTNIVFDTHALLSLLQRINKQVKENSKIAINSMDQLMTLLDGILELVRLEKNISTDRMEAFDAYELIQHNIELLQPVAQQKKLSLMGAIDKKVPQYIEGLRTHIDRSLINLISNALKFTENGSVKVSMYLLELENAQMIYKKGDKIVLEISVEDTGIGIPKDKHEIIFEHFSRLTPAYEGIYKGFGLGLYMVKLYVKAMNGSIKVESQVGKGTCFKMTVPFIVSDRADKRRYSGSGIPMPFICDKNAF